MKLDIHGVLEFLDERNLNVYAELSEDSDMLRELQKNISWLIPQWMTASPNETIHRKLVLEFDETCNQGWNRFYHHPELQTKLLALIGTGHAVKHRFFRPSGRRRPAVNDLKELLRREYPDAHDDEIALWCRDATLEELERLMDDMEVPFEKRAPLRKQYKVCQP